MSWLLRHSLGREPGAGWWSWRRRCAEGRGLAGPSRSLVSMVLTSQAHRRRTPKKNRRIPTIPTGCFGGWLVDVSAVDTGPRGSESGFLVVEPGAVAVWNHCHNCLRPCVVCRAQPRPPGGPSHVTNVMTSNIELYLAPARRPGGHGSTPVLPAPSRLRPELARVGLLHEGRDLLANGCAYCTKAPPTRSTPNPRPVAPHPRAVHPDDTGSHHSDRASPSPTSPSSSSPLRQTHPTDVLRCHDIRNSQKT